MKTLNIIGCGRVGRTLGRLWQEHSVFRISDVLNRSIQSAEDAVTFMGAGRAIPRIGQMARANVYLIGTPDDGLGTACGDLVDSGPLSAGSTVFHLSGATRSAVLHRVRERGALAASVHPVKSFADPEVSCRTFEGTHCGAEGDSDAVETLSSAFEAIGARIFRIDQEHKEIYHAASVFSCNYLTALLEVGLRAYMKAGIPRDTAFEIVEPIVRETIDNLMELDTAKALTGPIARGDHGTVSRQIAALNQWDPEICVLYRRLGTVALSLSRLQGSASPESIDALSTLLEKGDGPRS